MTSIILAKPLKTLLSNRICDGYPYETCGTFSGKFDGDTTYIVDFQQCKNLNLTRAQDRFVLDPDDFLDADKKAQAAGLDIVCIWHSHPDHPAFPSTTDLQAAWPGWSYLIASVSRQGIEDIRSWRLEQEQFEEEDIYYDDLSAHPNTA